MNERVIFRAAMLCAFAAGTIVGILVSALHPPVTWWSVPLLALGGAGIGAMIVGRW